MTTSETRTEQIRPVAYIEQDAGFNKWKEEPFPESETQRRLGGEKRERENKGGESGWVCPISLAFRKIFLIKKSDNFVLTKLGVPAQSAGGPEAG
jgi:hypothetical protein